MTERIVLPATGEDRRAIQLAVSRATDPVIVVPATWGGRDGPVVVGVGMEDGVGATLAFAAAEAAAAGVELRVIHAWQTTGTGEIPPVWDFGTESIPERQRRALEQLARMAQQAHPRLTVTAEAVQGPVVPQLLEAARTASLLVVGASHRAAMARAILGTTSRGLLAEPPCPVAVVP